MPTPNKRTLNWNTKVIHSQLSLKFDANIKEMGWLKKEKIMVVQERHQSIRIENLKNYTLKIENVQKKQKKTNGKQLCQKKSHCVRQKCKKLVELNKIYI